MAKLPNPFAADVPDAAVMPDRVRKNTRRILDAIISPSMLGGDLLRIAPMARLDVDAFMAELDPPPLFLQPPTMWRQR